MRLCTEFQHALTSLALICLIALLSGCQSFEYPDWNAQGLTRPQVGIVYHPYGPCMYRELAAPIPNYQGWSDERMLRDFGRLSQSGVDFVLVALDAKRLSQDDFYRQRFLRLMELAAAQEDWPQLALAITGGSESLDSASMKFITYWIVDIYNLNSKIFRQLDRRALVVLEPAYAAWSAHHPALTFRFTAPRSGQWAWPNTSSGGSDISSDRTQVALLAGGVIPNDDNSQFTWKVSRANGRTLRDAFRQAVAGMPQFICIGSWNNFQDGSFIEPNSLDEFRLYETLQDELRRFRRASIPTNR